MKDFKKTILEKSTKIVQEGAEKSAKIVQGGAKFVTDKFNAIVLKNLQEEVDKLDTELDIAYRNFGKAIFNEENPEEDEIFESDDKVEDILTSKEAREKIFDIFNRKEEILKKIEEIKRNSDEFFNDQFCPNCGKEISKEDLFCRKCGAKLTK